MKKIFIILIIVGFALAITSCEKTCTCNEYEDGVIVETYEDEAEPGERCSDLDDYDYIDGEGVLCYH